MECVVNETSRTSTTDVPIAEMGSCKFGLDVTDDAY